MGGLVERLVILSRHDHDVAAVAPLFHLPAAGVALVLAIDQILDMGRTMTNVIGNSVATAVIAKWEAKRQSAGRGAAQGQGGGRLAGELAAFDSAHAETK